MGREYPPAPLVGVGAAVIEDGRILLVRRGHEPLKGEWSLPGGALELGETLRQGVMREVLEETGLRVAPEALIDLLDKIVRDESDGAVRFHYVLADYLCRVEDPESERTPAPASDAEEARWVAREDAGPHGAYRVAPLTAAVIDKAFRMREEAHASASPSPFQT
jgi:ADP-ribose pyrophosphatase YjhB (NUDIX family)